MSGVDEVRAVFDGVDTACRVARASLLSITIRATEHLEKCNAAIDNMTTTMTQLESSLKLESSKSSKMESQLSIETRCVEDLKTHVRTLEDDNREFKKVSRIIAYEKENADLRKQIDALSKRKILQEDRGALLEELTVLRGQHAAHLEEVTVLRGQQVNMKKENEDLMGEIRVLTDVLKAKGRK